MSASFTARLAVACATLVATTAATGGGADLDFSAIVEGRLAIGTESARLQQTEFVFSPEVAGTLGDRVSFKAVGRLRFDFSDQLEPGVPGNDFRGRASRRGFIGSTGDVELREFYADIDIRDHFLRLGKQQIVWGEADGLKVLDVFNPQSFREFILPDFDQSRIGLWSANLELTVGDDSTLQLVWAPDQTYDELPAPGATFAFTSPRFVPAPPPGIPVTLAPPRRPHRVLRDSDVGLRYTTFIGGWQLSANYLYHYFDQPNFRRAISAGGVTIVPQYDRTHLLGGSFHVAFGDWVARGELGYSTARFFPTRDPHDADGVSAAGELAYVFGVDYQGVTDTFLSAQVFQSVLSNRAAGVVRDTNETTVTVLGERKFRNETWTASILEIHNLDDGDGVLQTSLGYMLRSHIELELGYDRFYGPRSGLFGQFNGNDRLRLQVKIGL